MSPRPRMATAHSGKVGFFRKHGCSIRGWVVGWATITFLSAGVQAAARESRSGIGAWGRAVFENADAVPPLAKLTLGALLAAGLAAAVRARGDSAPVPSLAQSLAHGVVAMAVALSLPIDYYPVDRTGRAGLTLLHLAAAATGGAVMWLAARACHRRRSARRD